MKENWEVLFLYLRECLLSSKFFLLGVFLTGGLILFGILSSGSRADTTIGDFSPVRLNRYISASTVTSSTLSMTITPTIPIAIVEARLHLSAAKNIADFAMTLNSANGAYYDVVFYTASGFTSNADLVVTRHTTPIILAVGDALNITMADKSTTAALEVLYKYLD